VNFKRLPGTSPIGSVESNFMCIEQKNKKVAPASIENASVYFYPVTFLGFIKSKSKILN
jgi:hypothetical protein